MIFGRKPADENDVLRNNQLAGHMPTRLIEQHDADFAGRDLGGDFGQMQAHRFAVASGHDEPCALAVLRAYGPKNIGGGRALVLRGARARALLGPTARDLVLLAYPSFIAKPDFEVVDADAPLACNRFHKPAEFFLKSSIAPSACS